MQQPHMKRTLVRWAAIAALLVGASACEKDIFDINNDPNNPARADINLVLPSGQSYVSFIVGGQYNILGEILAQHMTIQGGAQQYRNYDQYNLNSGTLDGRQFQNLYAGALQDFEFVITEGSAKDEWRMVGIAKILKAHTYQILTDLYGDLPYSEALQPKVTLTPRYDRQSEIYAGLQTLLDDGIANIRRQQGRFPGNADLNYQARSEADMTKWIRLANTLKLRLYLRLSEVDADGAGRGIAELYRQAATTGGFMQAGDDLQFANSNAANAENPFYQANFRIQNQLGICSTLGNYMANTFDPRQTVYFLDGNPETPSTFERFFGAPGASGSFIYSFPGTWFIGSQFTNSIGGVNKPGSAYPGLSATDAAAKARPTLLLTYEESLLLRAEAAVRGWTVGESAAQSLYEDGVRAAMARYGVSATQANAYLAGSFVNLSLASNVAAKVGRISIQKWVALFGTNGMEAWTEIRRTNAVPLVAPQVNALGAGRFVKRLPYPDSELQRNPNIASTGLAPGDVTTPVWWDVN